MAKIEGPRSFSDAAYEILKTAKTPLSAKEIVKEAIERGLIITHSKLPENTMASRLSSNPKRFISAGNAKWKLRK